MALHDLSGAGPAAYRAGVTTATDNPVLRVPPAPPEEAVAHFARRLAVECDVSDVHAAMAAGDPGFVLLDTRSRAAWDQGHVPGAVHLPTAEIAERAPVELALGTTVVTYCWGPGCNGATRAALLLAQLGHPVKEMLGGYEYWVREGFSTDGADGHRHGRPDPLTAPADGVACDC